MEDRMWQSVLVFLEQIASSGDIPSLAQSPFNTQQPEERELVFRFFVYQACDHPGDVEDYADILAAYMRTLSDTLSREFAKAYLNACQNEFSK